MSATGRKTPSRQARSKNPERRLDVFPCFQKVSGKRVIVIGEGGEAASKVRLLGETNAEIEVVAENLSEDLGEALLSVGARWHREPFSPSLLEGAVLVFSARGHEALDREVVEAAHTLGIQVNVVDRPDLCDFYTGALVNRAPVAVAISSTGVGPVLARDIRARIEALLPLTTGDLARLAERMRETVAQVLPHGSARRRFWQRFFSGSVAAKVHAGQGHAVHGDLQRLLNQQSWEEGFVSLVGAGPGAEDLLTLRAQRLLQEADVIVHDALVPEAVVAMGRRDADRISVGKRKGAHSAAQSEINSLLVRLAGEGKRVVRLKSGDPLVFGRAGEEMAALRAAGIAFEVVPGVTAALAAAASAHIPLTLRGVASSLILATGHTADGDTLPDWAGLVMTGATVSVYMGKSTAAKVARRLADAGLAPTTPVVVVADAALADERFLAGSLEDLTDLAARTDLDGPALILIGEAVVHADLTAAEPLSLAPAIAEPLLLAAGGLAA